MPFNIASFVNTTTNDILKSPFVTSVIKNPICTALMMTLIIIIIILIIFANSNNSILVLACRAGFWIFLVSCSFIFLHNKILMSELKEKEIEGSYGDIIGQALISGDDIIPVNINTNFNTLYLNQD